MQPSSSLCTGPVAAEVLEAFHRTWGSSAYAGRNPAPQPVSLERRHFEQLLRDDYMVSDKSDGTRYALFLTRAGQRDLAVLVNRKLDVFQIPVAARRGHFDGSLYDGELVECHGSHVFLVFDAVAHKGRYVGGEDFLARLSVIRSVFDLEGALVRSPEEASELAQRGKVICGGSAHGLRFRPKQCFQLRQIDTLLRQIPSLPYSVDGLILTPVREPVRCGTHETMYKFKTRHTVDLEVSSDGLSLLAGMGGAPNTAVLRVPLASVGRFVLLGDAAERMRASPGGILELLLTLCEGELQLSFQTVRTDKGHPNAAATVVSTAVNVKEAIEAEELVQLARAAAQMQDERSDAPSCVV